MFTNSVSPLGFKSLKTNIDVLKKIATDDICEKAYTRLMKQAQNTDILLELYKGTGAKVSKLGTLESDVVELSRNEDFVLGIEQAIEKIQNETQKTAQNPSSDFVDIARYRLMGFKN